MLLITFLLLLLLHDLLEQVSIVFSIGIVGVHFEHLLIGVDGRLELSLACHCVTQVVQASRIAACGEGGRTFCIVLRPILCNRSPIFILEQVYGIFGRALFEHALSLLIFCLPEIVPSIRVCLFIRWQDQKNCDGDPAAAE